jgi:sortase A
MSRCSALALVVGGFALLAFLLLRPVADAEYTAQQQHRLSTEVPVGPAAAVATRDPVPVARAVDLGAALAVLRIPRFGADWSWVAVEGTDLPQLAEGPGHYRGTPMPGARGNVGFAAHRAGHGDPFIDFDTLRPHDSVVLTQGRVRWTYRLVTAPRIVDVHATWVLRPSRTRDLTLTTCWPRYGSSRRMFVRGELVRVDGERAGHWVPVWPARRATAPG